MITIKECDAVKFISTKCINEKPDILLIAGPTGSGKSTISQKISNVLKAQNLSQDNYFKNEEDMELVMPEHGIRQWDTPDCYQWELLIKNITDIFNKNATPIPIFSHAMSRRVGEREFQLTNRPLIFEGLYTMDQRILDIIQGIRLKHYSVFLDIDEKTRWQRKYNRDVTERNENPETLRIWFENVIKPAELKWLNQQAKNADIVVTP